jgi:hypothetical protein
MRCRALPFRNCPLRFYRAQSPMPNVGTDKIVSDERPRRNDRENGKYRSQIDDVPNTGANAGGPSLCVAYCCTLRFNGGKCHGRGVRLALGESQPKPPETEGRSVSLNFKRKQAITRAWADAMERSIRASRADGEIRSRQMGDSPCPLDSVQLSSPHR